MELIAQPGPFSFPLSLPVAVPPSQLGWAPRGRPSPRARTSKTSRGGSTPPSRPPASSRRCSKRSRVDNVTIQLYTPEMTPSTFMRFSLYFLLLWAGVAPASTAQFRSMRSGIAQPIALPLRQAVLHPHFATRYTAEDAEGERGHPAAAALLGTIGAAGGAFSGGLTGFVIAAIFCDGGPLYDSSGCTDSMVGSFIFAGEVVGTTTGVWLGMGGDGSYPLIALSTSSVLGIGYLGGRALAQSEHPVLQRIPMWLVVPAAQIALGIAIADGT